MEQPAEPKMFLLTEPPLVKNPATEELLVLPPPQALTKPLEADQLELLQPPPPLPPPPLQEPTDHTETTELAQDQDQVLDMELDQEPEQVPLLLLPQPQLLEPPLPPPPTEAEALVPDTA